MSAVARLPLAGGIVVVGGIALASVSMLAPDTAQAQRMSLALSRLSTPNDPAAPCVENATHCADNDAWQSVMTQLTGALIPPLVEPARTRGPRSFYLGVETMLTGIESTSDYWQRATEGDAGTVDRNRSVDSIFAWTRLSLRKPLPFGFEIGTSAGYLVNTDYFTLGLEIRWALLEGWTGRDWWVPDLAIRGAVQTLVGDAQFNATVVAIDATLSNSFVLGDALELSPYIAGQINWVFADSELVDLTPERDAFAECDPEPNNPSGVRPLCRGDGSDFNNNTVFQSIRTMRPRMIFGAQARYEIVTVNAAFSFDVQTPNEADRALPASLPRQWRLDLGLGFSY